MNNLETTPDLFAAMDATWAAARFEASGPWTLRVDEGGGNRVSAATLNAGLKSDDIAQAEDAMRALDQVPLFMVRAGDEALDAALEARGYAMRDAVVIYACPVEKLTDQPLPRVTAFTIWPPLAIMREIWAAGGIGPTRLAIMDRVAGAKTGVLARHRDKPGGVAFAAIHEDICMVHAVEIPPHQRQQGVAGWIMRCAAFWAAEHGAQTLSVMCTRDNTGANALYRSLGMDAVGHYHYRHLPSEIDPK